MSINDLIEEAQKLYDCFVLIGAPVEQKDPSNVQTQCNVSCKASDLPMIVSAMLRTLEKMLEDAFSQARLFEQDAGQETQETILRNVLTPYLLNGCSTLTAKYTNIGAIVEGIIQDRLQEEAVPTKNAQGVTLH